MEICRSHAKQAPPPTDTRVDRGHGPRNATLWHGQAPSGAYHTGNAARPGGTVQHA